MIVMTPPRAFTIFNWTEVVLNLEECHLSTLAATIGHSLCVSLSASAVLSPLPPRLPKPANF